MNCFSMQKLRKRYNGSEQAGSLEETAGIEADEESSPSMASSASSTRMSFRYTVRAIQNAQRFINGNPKLRSSHPSYGSKESKKDAPDVAVPLLPLVGRARSATERSSALFDVAVAYRPSGHVEAGAPTAHLSPLVDYACADGPVLRPLPSPYQALQSLHEVQQPWSAYRLPLPSQNAHNTSPAPASVSSVTCNQMQIYYNSISVAQCQDGTDIVPSSIPMRDAIINANCPTPELQPLPPPNRDSLSISPLRCFKYDELSSACQNFALDCCINDSDMCFNGTVKVKGSWKPGKLQDVLILVQKEPQQQGLQEWISKLSMLAHELHQSLHVCNLVGFYGEDGLSERMLVYEGLKKGTLSSLLFETSDIPPLEWSARIKIAYGAAQGLATLHEKFPNFVLYKDFGASSIQVDHDHSSKVSLYRFVDLINAEIQAGSNNLRVNGYRAPETVRLGELTLKSNVWSFGVILLEVLSGKQHNDEGTTKKNARLDLVKWAKPFLVDEGKLFLLMDPKLKGKFPSRGAKMVADLALVCLQRDPTERPSMREALDVVRDVHESRYMTRSNARETSGIRKVSSSSLLAFSSSTKPSLTNQQKPKCDIVECPPLRPLIIPPRCCGEDIAHHQHEYSPAPLADVNF